MNSGEGAATGKPRAAASSGSVPAKVSGRQAEQDNRRGSDEPGQLWRVDDHDLPGEEAELVANPSFVEGENSMPRPSPKRIGTPMIELRSRARAIPVPAVVDEAAAVVET
jgi:hypothetical protein